MTEVRTGPEEQPEAAEALERVETLEAAVTAAVVATRATLVAAPERVEAEARRQTAAPAA
jgi:hypothetical protein